MVSFAHILTGLFWLTMVVLALGLAKRSAYWRQGQEAAFSWVSLLTVPKRYFVDLHHVVAREPYIARVHVATAGGAVAVLGLVALNYGLMLYQTWLDYVILFFALVMLAGSIAVWQRRRNAPSRLSKGAWSRLPVSLIAFSLGTAVLMITHATASVYVIAALAMVGVLLGAIEFARGIGAGGPMKHAIAGLLHLAFHPRQDRFDGKRSTDLKPLNLEKGEFGVAKPSDITWNRLLSFDACVQCGKCEANCPAFAAGQPLNPKKLIQDMVVGMVGGSDASFAGSPYPGKPVGQHSGAPDQPIIGQLVDADTIWSCTTCRACVQECPMLIEHVDTIVNIRRNITLTTGDVPNKGAEALENLRTTDTVGGYPVEVRYNWSIDLDVPVLQPGQQTDWLLVAGEGAFDMRYQRALRALVKVLKHAGVQFAVLGSAEKDCGDLARRLGDEAGFQRLAKENIALLKNLKFKRIVTPDPHVFHCLKNEYPAFGGEFEVHHHSQVIQSLMKDDRLRLKASATAMPDFTYHDPCYLGRYNGETDAPRNVLKGIGIKVVEMERSGMKARCCGWGGGSAFTDIPGEARISDMRMQDVKSTGAAKVAVACPNCTAMLEGVVGDRPDVVELAELVAERLAD
ncbi:(Fe-S)-binding protein [Leeia sp. TBRC 13508]|uniref:(Fe-S)-binding protein n=1 Tax=Leeia speluncae TaxID=2884804 RepID=A0ABS8DAI3_9NEIS|nr:(Fe-S)-binding protein [Leeia speluncae]MCB6185172.1 (Fe-S)-binding protein [Leeia speluncae]